MAGVQQTLEAKNPKTKEDFITYIGKSKGGIFDFFFNSEISQFDIHYLISKYKSREAEYSADDFISFA